MVNKNILIVTPHTDFGEIVSRSIGGQTPSKAFVVHSVSDAHVNPNTEMDFVLLDLEMGVDQALEQVNIIRGYFPRASLVLIHKKSPPPELDAVRPWNYLKKPFSQNDLIGILNIGNSVFVKDFVDREFQKDPEDSFPIWIHDEIRATKSLDAALSNLDVQEAILFSNSRIIAHSGILPVEAVEECSSAVQSSLHKNASAEVLRPVLLNTTQKRHLIHATILAVGIILALTFDENIPFDIIRSQTRYLASVLRNPQLPPPEVKVLPKDSEEKRDKVKVFPTTERNPSDTQFENPLPSIKGAPDSSRGFSAKISASREIVNQSDFGDFIDHPQEKLSHSPSRMTNTEGAQSTVKVSALKNKYTLYTRMESLNREDHGFLVRQEEIPESGRAYLIPNNPGMLGVGYACVLVPRMKTHLLIGDPADFLKNEIPNIFLAYGWRLEEMQVEPGYFQWLVRIPPTISPAAHIKIIRKKSSQLLLENYYKVNRNQFQKDFWSPGYLLGSGEKLLSQDTIEEYIELNRRQYYSEPAARR